MTGDPTNPAPVAGCLEAALWYADLGLRVLPNHSVEDGRCSCGQEDCKKVGKHPRIEDWGGQATTDPVAISRWFSAWPNANVGILTGKTAGLAVLDLDPGHGGDESVRRLEERHGALPPTWEVKTGSGGRHIYFKAPSNGAEIKSTVGKVAAGLDVRAEGGQVVAPPSLHASGNRYAWVDGRRPGEAPLAELPAWLLDLMLAASRPQQKGAPPVPERIVEGSRNATLTSLAGSMRRRGMAEDSILAGLLAENAQKCDPPLEEDEVRKIAESVSRYDPADPPDPHPSQEQIAAARDLVTRVIEQTKSDPGAPFEAEAVRALLLLRDSLPAEYERARASLRELKVGLRRLEAEIDEVDPTLSEAGDSTEAGLLASFANEIELFHRADGESFATIPVGKHKETWPVKSRDFRRWLVRQFYEKVRQPPKGQALADAICLLEARAQFDGEKRDVWVRVAGFGEVTYIDLVNDDWSAVEVTAGGWRIVVVPLVRFRRGKGMIALPTPKEGGSLETLRRFLNVSEDDEWRLVVVFLTSALRPKGPYPVLVLHGEQGSAKSTTARVIRAVVDPNSSPLRSEPRNGHDLMIGASNSWIVCFDNLSSLPIWLSDCLCRLATGGGFSARTLYTDDEEKIFEAQRPVIATGIEELATRADILERSIILYLPAIPEEKRRREEDFWKAFNEAHPEILGALIQTVADAMRELPGVKLERLPRMADFATWGVAVERALGWPSGSFLKAYEANRDAVNDLVIEATSLGSVIIEFARKRPAGWEGTATELLGILTIGVDDTKRRKEPWAKSPKALSDALRRLVPNLRTRGLGVTFKREGGRRLLVIQKVAGESAAPAAPAAPESQVPRDKDLRCAAGGAADSDAAGAAERDADERVTQPAAPCGTSASSINTLPDQGLGRRDAQDAENAQTQTTNSTPTRGVL